MAKSNKDFKKPVNNQEVIVDDDEKNKKLIVIVCLSIVIVLGLIIASITYFNGRDVEDDKKETDNKNKPTEVIKPVEENKKPVVDEPAKPVVYNPVITTPKDDVAATPEDPKDETPALNSVDENDYEVRMEGNVAYVSGVSRFITSTGKTFNNAVILKVPLDNSYSKDQLEKYLTVTTTTNGVTTNNYNFEIKSEKVIDPETGSITEPLYFEWVQPVGSGYEKPTSFTLNYGDGNTQTYEVNLDELKVEYTVDGTPDEDMFVVPVSTQPAVSYPYEVEVYRQLSKDEIVWADTPSKADVEDSEEVLDTLDNQPTTTDTESGLGEGDTPVVEPAPTPESYSKNLDYTIKFDVDETKPDYASWDGVLVIKIYAPIIRDENTNAVKVVVDPNQVTIENKSKVTIGNVTKDTTSNLDDGSDNPNYNNYYVTVSYDTKADGATLENQKFTIDWDKDGEDYGLFTYEFDLSDLREIQSKAPAKTNLNENNIDDETIQDGISDGEQPNEVNLDAQVQPETPSASPLLDEVDSADTGVIGTLD